MLNRFKTDEFFLSNICLTSADKKTSAESNRTLTCNLTL